VSNIDATCLLRWILADGRTGLDMRFDGETAWLAQAQVGELLEAQAPNIDMRVQNVLEEGESETALLLVSGGVE
jgi:hypothetical protein